MQQRGALAVAHGKVWIPFGAQAGDCGDYKGRVVGVNLDGSGTPVFYSPPTKRGGGMWNPAGVTVGRDGNILVVSANGAAFPGDSYDNTNSVLRLDGEAKLLDSFAPTDWAANNQGDVGLGSQGVALVGDKWAVFGGKSGPVYVLRQDKLGGIGGQVDVQNICRSFGGAAVNGSTVYLPCTDGVRAVQVDDAGKLQVLWHADRRSPARRSSAVDGSGCSIRPAASCTRSTRRRVGASVRSRVGTANRFATPAIGGRERHRSGADRRRRRHPTSLSPGAQDLPIATRWVSGCAGSPSRPAGLTACTLMDVDPHGTAMIWVPPAELVAVTRDVFPDGWAVTR